MFCSNCGIKLHDGARFCHNCGAPVPVQAAGQYNQNQNPDPMIVNDGFSHSMTTLRGGFIEWAVSFDDERYHHRKRYILMDKEIVCFSGSISLSASWGQKKFNVGAEVLSDILLIFGDNNETTDMAVEFDQDLPTPGGITYDWSLKYKKIKEIRGIRGESRICLRSGAANPVDIRVYPQDFDAIWSRLISLCPNAMIFQG